MVLRRKIFLNPSMPSSGVVISKEVLKRLSLGRGETLFATETPAGYLLAPCDPEVEEELKLGREFMKKYHETCKALRR